MNLNFRQQSVGETTYLIWDMDDNLPIDSFAVNMMSHNHIANIVPVQIVQVNDKKQAQFNITGLTKLSNRMATVRLKKEVLLTLNSILNAFEEVDAYMLDMDHMLLDWEHIYLDGQGNCLLLYLPFDNTFNRDKIDFLQEVVSRIKPDYQERDPYLYDILNAFSRRAVRKLSDFRELIKKYAGVLKEEPKEGKSIALPENVQKGMVQAVNSHPQVKEEKAVLQTAAKKPEKKSSLSPKIPVINIPGREPGSKATRQEPAHEKREEKKKEEKKALFKKKSEKQSPFAIPKKQKEDKIIIPETENRKILSPDMAFRDNMDSKKEAMYESYESTIMMPEYAKGVNGNGEEGTVLLQETDFLEPVSARLIRRKDGVVYRIDGDRAMIGSGEAADIRIENNHAISRSHAWIRRINGKYFVEDNQSKNGTFVNGMRLQPKIKEAVCAGSILRLANEDFEFVLD